MLASRHEVGGKKGWEGRCKDSVNAHLLIAHLYIPEGSNNVPHSKVLVMFMMQGMQTHSAILPTSMVNPSIETQFQVLSK
jgi:hypothetical protein